MINTKSAVTKTKAATTVAAMADRVSALLWFAPTAHAALTIGQANARAAFAAISRFSTLFPGLD